MSTLLTLPSKSSHTPRDIHFDLSRKMFLYKAVVPFGANNRACVYSRMKTVSFTQLKFLFHSTIVLTTSNIAGQTL